MGLDVAEGIVEETGGMLVGAEGSLSAAGEGWEKDSKGVTCRVIIEVVGGGLSMPREDGKDVLDVSDGEDVAGRAKGKTYSSKRTSREM